MASFGEDQMKADAQLIAAAPELLEALTEAGGAIQAAADIMIKQGNGRTAERFMDYAAKCLNAIAKATKEDQP